MDLAKLTDSEIEELVRRHSLPEGVEDCVLNREEMAEALATSLPSLSTWINAGMPVLKEGGNGQSYELQLAHCWAWRQEKRAVEDLASQKRRETIQAMRLALVGGEAGDSLEALPAKERREIIAVQMVQEEFQVSRNQLLRRDDVLEMTENLFAMVRDVMESAPDQVERVMPLPPKAVDALQEICDGLVKQFARKIDDYWADRPERKAAYLKQDMFEDG
jgi:phage terminase Nu1 subunit (DNA packaging protein)